MLDESGDGRGVVARSMCRARFDRNRLWIELIDVDSSALAPRLPAH
jgi:hypothetical protein